MLSALALVLVLICALLLFSQVQALLQNLLRQISLRIWSPLFSIVAKPQDLPELPLLLAARNEMRAAGFTYTHTRRYRDLCFSRHDFAQVCEVYYHPERDVHARVFPTSFPHKAGACYEVELSNTYIDGTSILTMWRGSARFSLLPNTATLVRARLPDVHNLLQAHLRRRQHIASVRTVASDALLIARTWSERMLLWLEHEGKVSLTAQRHVGRDLYRLTLATACKMAWQEWRAAVWRGIWTWQSLGKIPNKVANKVANKAANNFAPDAELLHQAQQILVRQHWAYAISQKTPHWLKFAPSVLTGTALLLISARLGGTPALLAAVLVLAWYLLSFLLLSGGRYLLKRAGQQIHPLLAVVAQLARPALAMLLGSVIFVAMALEKLPSDAVLWWVALLAIVFNLLQLLPLRPFLGGQIIELLSSWNWPRIFLLLGLAAACAAIGLYFSRYGLLLLTVLLVLCVPRLWHQVRVRWMWKRARRSDAPLASLWQLLARARLCTSAGRIALARAAAQQTPPLGATASMFGLTLYASCLLLPALVFMTLLLSFPSRSLTLWQQSHVFVHLNKQENTAPPSPLAAQANKRGTAQANYRKEPRQTPHPTVQVGGK